MESTEYVVHKDIHILSTFNRKKRGPYLQGLDPVVFFNKREAFCTRNERQKIGVQGLAPAGFLF
jgi:hypothetical protein